MPNSLVTDSCMFVSAVRIVDTTLQSWKVTACGCCTTMISSNESSPVPWKTSTDFRPTSGRTLSRDISCSTSARNEAVRQRTWLPTIFCIFKNCVLRVDSPLLRWLPSNCLFFEKFQKNKSSRNHILTAGDMSLSIDYCYASIMVWFKCWISYR